MSNLKLQKCGVKVKYPTYDVAQRGMKNLLRHKREKNLHVYQCPDCQKFHVGHITQYEVSKQKAKKATLRYKRA